MRFILGILLFLVISSCSEDQIKSEPQSKDTQSKTDLFTLIPSNESGINFINEAQETDLNNYFTNQYIYNGGGVGIGDINNDNLPDIYLTGNSVEDKLYLNKGNLQFEDITKSAGIDSDNDLWSTGVSMVDINGDGWLDIYVCKSGHNTKPEESENKFYLNKGDGTFIEAGRKLGLNDPGFSTQCSFFDYDRDGDLDVYVMNYPGDWSDNNKNYVQLRESGALIPFRIRDHFYRNEGNAKFTEIGAEIGINNLGFGLGLMTADFNDDGWIDIYVGNDYVEPDYLYINQKNGTFKDEIKDHCNHLSQSSMGLDFADFNNDGLNDLFVAEMLPSDLKRSKVNMAAMNTEVFNHFINQGKHYQYMHNVFQLNTGNEFYSDISQFTGTDKTDWSWSPLLADFDQDGDKDLFVSNGIKRDMLYKDANNERKKLKEKGEKVQLDVLYNMIPSTKLKNRYFENKGDLNFSDESDASGIGVYSFSNGAIYADLDNDGDLDIVTNNIDEKAFIYRNESNSENHVSFNLYKANSANRKGLNSSIFVFQDGQMQRGDVLPVRGFQSSTETELNFALAKNQKVDSVIVLWDDYTVQWEYDFELRNSYTITYKPEGGAIKEDKNHLFKEITNQLGDEFVHIENDFNDFETEILLPHKQSAIGPFISSGDFNGDGLDDFFIGGAKGQSGMLFKQLPGNKFSAKKLSQEDREAEDMGSTFFDIDQDGDLDLFVVSGGNENKGELLSDRLYLNDGNGNFKKSIDFNSSLHYSGSKVVSEDFDKDGDEDLFIGGRGTPGKYPASEPCIFYENINGQLTDATDKWLGDYSNLGIITDILISDINSDEAPDLILCGEWTSVLYLKNTGEKFVKSSLGFEDSKWSGWYYSLHQLDYDQDGDLDIIAGNMGENHKFKPSQKAPFKIYMSDFDENETCDILLALQDEDNKYFPVRGKQCLSEQMPFISEEKFNSYEDFSQADIEVIFQEKLDQAEYKLEASNFASIVLINSNGKYSIEKLDNEFQLGPLNGIVSSDFNKNGITEILSGGNLFETEVETSRADANVGIYKEGDQVRLNSGFFIPGDVKDIQIIRGENCQLILVANNNGKLQVFRNL